MLLKEKLFWAIYQIFKYANICICICVKNPVSAGLYFFKRSVKEFVFLCQNNLKLCCCIITRWQRLISASFPMFSQSGSYVAFTTIPPSLLNLVTVWVASWQPLKKTHPGFPPCTVGLALVWGTSMRVFWGGYVAAEISWAETKLKQSPAVWHS